MSNYAWVCFTCRAAVRRHGRSDHVLCPSCGQPCQCIGYKTPVPPKSKPKAWEQLRVAYYEAKQARSLKLQQTRTRRVHSLEQEIARLEAMSPNPGRIDMVAYLKKQLVAASA